MKAFLILSALAAVAGAGTTVTQKANQFSVARVSVRVGETVTFRNEDEVAHNVYSQSKDFSFNLMSQLPGASAPVTFDKPGEIEVRCAFHPTMKMQVTVTP